MGDDMEAAMVSVGRSFNPENLEVLDRVYALACLYIEAQHLCGAAEWDKAKEIAAVRKAVFVAARAGRMDFDTLCDKVLARVDERRARSATPLD